MIKIQIKWTLPEDGEKEPHRLGKWVYDKKYYNQIIKDMRYLGARRKTLYINIIGSYVQKPPHGPNGIDF
jgi:hypothetical protein